MNQDKTGRMRYAVEGHTHDFSRQRESKAAPDVITGGEQWNEWIWVNDYGTYMRPQENMDYGAGGYVTYSFIDYENINDDYLYQLPPENVLPPEQRWDAHQWWYQSVKSNRFQIETSFIGEWEDRPEVGPVSGFMGALSTVDEWFDEVGDFRSEQTGVYVDKDTIYACQRHCKSVNSDDASRDKWISDENPVREYLHPLSSFEKGHTYRFLLDVEESVGTVKLTSTNGDNISHTLPPMSQYHYRMDPYIVSQVLTGNASGRLGWLHSIEIRTPLAGWITPRPA